MSVKWRKVIQKSSILEVPWTGLANSLDIGDEGKRKIRHS